MRGLAGSLMMNNPAVIPIQPFQPFGNAGSGDDSNSADSSRFGSADGEGDNTGGNGSTRIISSVSNFGLLNSNDDMYAMGINYQPMLSGASSPSRQLVLSEDSRALMAASNIHMPTTFDVNENSLDGLGNGWQNDGGSLSSNSAYDDFGDYGDDSIAGSVGLFASNSPVRRSLPLIAGGASRGSYPSPFLPVNPQSPLLPVPSRRRASAALSTGTSTASSSSLIVPYPGAMKMSERSDLDQAMSPAKAKNVSVTSSAAANMVSSKVSKKKIAKTGRGGGRGGLKKSNSCSASKKRTTPLKRKIGEGYDEIDMNTASDDDGGGDSSNDGFEHIDMTQDNDSSSSDDDEDVQIMNRNISSSSSSSSSSGGGSSGGSGGGSGGSLKRAKHDQNIPLAVTTTNTGVTLLSEVAVIANMSDLPPEWQQKLNLKGRGKEIWAALELRLLSPSFSGKLVETSNISVLIAPIPHSAKESSTAPKKLASKTGKKRKQKSSSSKAMKKRRKKSSSRNKNFSRDEERTMVLAIREHGESMGTWQKLAAVFPTRSISELHGHWKDFMARVQRKAAKKKKASRKKK